MANNSAIEEQQVEAGYLLKKMRRRRKMTQNELSLIMSETYGLDYSVSQISRFENGSSAQPMEYIIQCCVELGVHPITFMSCLLHKDRKRYKIAFTEDSGTFYHNLLEENYRIFGDMMMKLTMDDMMILKSLVQSYIQTKYGQCDPQNDVTMAAE